MQPSRTVSSSDQALHGGPVWAQNAVLKRPRMTASGPKPELTPRSHPNTLTTQTTVERVTGLAAPRWVPLAMRLGAHMPTRGGVWRALERGAQLGCEVVQLFVKNNMQWFGRPLAPPELDLYANTRAGCALAAVFGHTGYLINVAAPPSTNRDHSIRSLIQEVQLAASLDLPFLVLHPGAHLGQGEEHGLRQAAAALDEVFAATRELPVRIALENTAGQGTCLGYRLEHLAALYDMVQQPARLGVCLDTAHLFAAGYDLRQAGAWDAVVAEVSRLVGLDQILAVHLNDSKAPLGSRVDRHAGIGQGHLGAEAFRPLLNDPRFADTPGCLETPKSPDLHEDAENLAVLRSLLGPHPAPKHAPGVSAAGGPRPARLTRPVARKTVAPPARRRSPT